MTFQVQTDENPFQFHIIFLGRNPIKDHCYNRTKENVREIRHVEQASPEVTRQTYLRAIPGEQRRAVGSTFKEGTMKFVSLPEFTPS